MTYDVIVQRFAREGLSEAYARVARHAPSTVDKWFLRFRDALNTLSVNPQRCPLARENRKVEIELREFHFGRRPNVFRVIFTIETHAVRILGIRRAQRGWLTRREIEQSLQDETEGV